ncbi:MAG: methionine--tRNA ligase [Deltaproteobacteria bacterium]
MKRMLVTSALPYANGPIHLGHLVEVIQTDIFVRYQRLLGRDVVYVCADDTHGTPIELSARKQGIEPKALVARIHEEHVRDFSGFGIGFDTYGSTDTAENYDWAKRVFERLGKGGHVERRAMELTYCEKDQRFLPDRFVRGSCPRCGAADQYGDVCEACKSTYSPTELKDPRCALCGTPPVRRPSEHFFFKLKDFNALLSSVANGTAEPELDPQVKNFLRGWLDRGLEDWCVSRDGPYFGFEIPDAPGKYFYVWLDAPIGYVSNTEILCQRLGDRTVLDYWGEQADCEIWHFIGKDIIYFHALFWPAMLRGASLRLPHRIVVHGMLNVRGEKMSKSRGRLRTAREYLDTPGLSPEQLRYYIAASLTPEPSDIDLNVEDFRHRVNADLVNNVANFCHRTLSLLRVKYGGRLAAPAEFPEKLKGALGLLRAARVEGYDELDFRTAMKRLVEASNLGNEFLQEKKPWAAEGPQAQADLSLAANLAFALAVLLQPVVPEMAGKLLAQLGREGAGLSALEPLWGGGVVAPWLREAELREGGPLMPRIEPAAAAALLPEEPVDATPASTSPSTPTSTSTSTSTSAEIQFDDFAKVDLRCGLVVAAEPVEGAKKLLRLTIDLGEAAPRTIASGIAEAFAPAALVGRRVVVVANLAPKTIRGIRSHGMLLAGGEGKGIRLCELPADVAPGSQVR